MWRGVLFLILFTVGEAQSEEIQEELCRGRVRDQMLSREQAKRHSYNSTDLLKEYSTDPIKKYNFESEVRRCSIELVKRDFDSGEDLSRYCPSTKSAYTSDCLRSWMSRQKVETPQEVARWADVAATAGKNDSKQLKADPQLLGIFVYESVVIAMEKYAGAKRGPAAVNPDARLEEIRQYEERVYVEVKDKLLNETFTNLDRLSHAPKRGSTWVEEKMREIKARVEKLK